MSLSSLLLPIKRKFRNNYKLYNRVAPIFGIYRNTRMALARKLHGFDDNLVVFSSFDGRSYNDNPRYISEALHELRPQTDIVWLFKDAQVAHAAYEVPDYVRTLDTISSEGVSALARSRVAVDNFNKRFYLNYPAKNQIYIQTWHGDRAFKKVGYDHPERHTYMLEERCTLCVAGSDYGERQIRTAFHYQGEILRVGCPRNDILVRNDPALRSAIRKSLCIAEDECALLYAPTYRDANLQNHSSQRVCDNLTHALDTLERTTGKAWRCLMRAHYFADLDLMDANADTRMFDVSAYPEMGELLLAADALLTDYSSCAGDFALLHRPIYLWQDDLEDYIDKERKLYFDIKDSPYWVATCPDELDKLIEQTTPEGAWQNCEEILNFYVTTESGHAAQTVAEYIVAKLDEAKGSHDV